MTEMSKGVTSHRRNSSIESPLPRFSWIWNMGSGALWLARRGDEARLFIFFWKEAYVGVGA